MVGVVGDDAVVVVVIINVIGPAQVMADTWTSLQRDRVVLTWGCSWSCW